jgi:hypothetical protein
LLQNNAEKDEPLFLDLNCTLHTLLLGFRRQNSESYVLLQYVIISLNDPVKNSNPDKRFELKGSFGFTDWFIQESAGPSKILRLVMETRC